MNKETQLLLRDLLINLRSHMHRMQPDAVADDGTPFEFWLVDDELYLETLSYLPLMMSEAAMERFDELPLGFRLAVPVYWLEDDYQVNGWTALANAGEWMLPRAIAAYREIGMGSEADALQAALEAVRADPEDEAAHEAAYKSVTNPTADDDARADALAAYFLANRSLFVATSGD